MGVAQGVEPALDGRSHGAFDQPPHEDEVQCRLPRLHVGSNLSRPHCLHFRIHLKKGAARFLSAPFFCCRWLRQATFEILAPVLPCGRGNFPMAGGSSVFSTSAWQTAPVAQPSASRCRGTIRRTTTPPSGNTSPTTEIFEANQPTRGEEHKSRGGWV